MTQRLTCLLLLVFGCLLTANAQPEPSESYLPTGYSAGQVDGYWGTDSKAHVCNAIRLTGDQLNGHELVALQCAIGTLEKVADCKVFVKKDLNKEENLYEQRFTPTDGWNFVRFDYPLSLTGLTELYVGYELTSVGQFVGYERTSAPQEGADYVRCNQEAWTSLSEQLHENVVHPITVLLSGGDYTALAQHDVTLRQTEMPSVVKADEAFALTGTLRNTGVQPLRSFETVCRIDQGEETRQAYTVDLMPGACTDMTFPLTSPKGTHTLHFRIEAPNGTTTADPVELTATVDAYEKAFEHTLLLDYFTGQSCANCPAGKAALEKAIGRNAGRMAFINHHAGYSEDQFTLDESLQLASLWNVVSAPSLVVDRQPTTVNQATSLVFHPSYATTDLIRQRIRNASLVGIQLENQCYQGDSTLALTVRVEKDAAFDKAAWLHVYLCESGYVAFQSGPGGGYPDYVHDHFPRHLFTALEGEPLTFDETGCCERTYTYRIPATYATQLAYQPTTDAHPERMEVVAFVADFDTQANDYTVYNSTVQALHMTEGTHPASIGQPVGTTYRLESDGHSLALEGDGAKACVFTPTGQLVGTLTTGKSIRLAGGIYLIRVLHGGKMSTEKRVCQ